MPEATLEGFCDCTMPAPATFTKERSAKSLQSTVKRASTSKASGPGAG